MTQKWSRGKKQTEKLLAKKGKGVGEKEPVGRGDFHSPTTLGQ